MDRKGIIVLFRIFACLVSLMIAAPALAQTASPAPVQVPAPVPDATAAAKPPSTQKMEYRHFIWGVTKEDVRKYETAVFYKEEGDSLYFVYQPDIFRRVIRYDFYNNKLVGIRHSVEDYTYPNSRRIVEDSQDVQMALTKLYGEPSSQEFFWKNKQYEKFPSYWGRSLYSRDLIIQITWLLADAKITLRTLRGKVFYELYYTIEPLDAASTAPNAIDLGVEAVEPTGSRP